jgi:hypothetical protein
MEISVDKHEYTERQIQLVREIVGSVYARLRTAGIPTQQARKLTTEISFAVCSIVDGSQVMYCGQKRLAPALLFADDPDYTKLLSASVAHSWTHEYVHGMEDKIIEKQQT